MTDDSPADETVEITPDRWIALSFRREWPRYVAEWSIRQRSGESDFPVAGGRVDAVPRSAETSEDVWSGVREQALAEAQQAMNTPASSGERKRSLTDRLFGRR